MGTPESSRHDDHSGRRDDIVETFGEEMLQYPGYVRMSSSSIIRSRDMKRYQDLYDSGETDEGQFIEKALVYGGAATLSFAIVALARHRLKKNNEE